MKNYSILLILFFLTGCVSIPDIEKRDVVALKDVVNTDSSIKVETKNWWYLFKDNDLNLIIENALIENRDVKITILNIEKSFLSMKNIEAENYPLISLNTILEKEKTSALGFTPPPYGGEVIKFSQMNISLDQQIDYLNKNSFLLKEAKSKIKGLEFKKEEVQNILVFQIIKNYAYYQYLLMLEDLINEQYEINTSIIEKQEKQRNLGFLIDKDLTIFRNNLIKLKNDKEQLNIFKQTTINNLKNISFDNSLTIKKNKKIWELLNLKPIENINSNVLKEKPELKYFLTNINAQENKLESAKIDFYPSISLNGDIGFQKIGFNNLLINKSLFWNFGPSIYFPIFDASKIKTNYKINGIDLNIFIEQYNKAFFESLQNLNTAINKNKQTFIILDNQKIIFKNNEKDFLAEKEKYKLGLTSKLQNEISSFELLNNKKILLNAELDFLNGYFELVNCLSGVPILK